MSKRFALSAKVVILDDEGRCLLLRRSMPSRNNKGKWDLPGGKVDAGEAFEEALIREVAEETGLMISLERTAGVAESDLPDRKVAYLIMEAHLVAGTVQLSEEHDDFMWAGRSRLATVDACEQFRLFLEAFSSD